MSSSFPPRPSQARSWANLLSTLLFLAAIGFAAAAIYFYLADRDKPDGPLRAESTPGANEAASVVDALRAQGLDADYQRFQARADQLEPPGQVLKVNGQDVLVFIYTSDDPAHAVATREADVADLDPLTVEITRRVSRTEMATLNDGKDVHVFQKSNIVVILIGGDEELTTKIDAAVESLP